MGTADVVVMGRTIAQEKHTVCVIGGIVRQSAQDVAACIRGHNESDRHTSNTIAPEALHARKPKRAAPTEFGAKRLASGAIFSAAIATGAFTLSLGTA